MANLRRVADTVRARTGFRSVLTGQDVVVVPVLISTGKVSTEKLPRDLKGLPMKYTPEGLLPHPGMALGGVARAPGDGAGLLTRYRVPRRR